MSPAHKGEQILFESVFPIYSKNEDKNKVDINKKRDTTVSFLIYEQILMQKVKFSSKGA